MGPPRRIAAAPDLPVNPDLLRHVQSDRVEELDILYGEIKIDPAKLKMREP